LLLVPQANAPPKIVVIDDWRSVVEYDASGRLLARHDLQLPPELVVSFLRTAVDSQGKRSFVAFANDMPQLFIFDEEWKKLATYPEGERVGIADVQLADLSGTGEPTLLVGYWDAVGVQGVSLAGKRLWGNRVMQTAFRLAISAKNADGKRNVLCVNGSETIGPFNSDGKAVEFVNLPGRMIEWIASDDLGPEGQTKTVLISAHDPQKSHFIGLDDDGREQWTYATIKGTPQKPVERVVSGKLADGRGVWLLAVADGSIHFVLPDGKPLDKFNYGSELTGLALAVIDGKNVLIVASKDGLTAWQVDE
jgi:hypothetical protein